MTDYVELVGKKIALTEEQFRYSLMRVDDHIRTAVELVIQMPEYPTPQDWAAAMAPGQGYKFANHVHDQNGRCLKWRGGSRCPLLPTDRDPATIEQWLGAP